MANTEPPGDAEPADTEPAADAEPAAEPGDTEPQADAATLLQRGQSLRRRRALTITGVIVSAAALFGIGISIGAASTRPATRTRTVIKIVTVPGPTVTVSVTAKAAPPAAAAATMPGSGTFVVGTASGDWAPGTWQSSGGNGSSIGDCYWATLSNMTGSVNAIIANNIGPGPTVMTVPSSALGVQVAGCATWHKAG